MVTSASLSAVFIQSPEKLAGNIHPGFIISDLTADIWHQQIKFKINYSRAISICFCF